MNSEHRHIHAFTVDVEDGINILMRDLFHIQMDPTERVISNTQIILDLLEAHAVHATFFILGDVAKHYPDLVRNIHQKGHEIGVHGYSHKQYFLLSREELRKELRDAKSLLEDLTGDRVYGHRAPAFSIGPGNAWALEEVAATGFAYDSSIMPAKARHYGWPGSGLDMHRLEWPSGDSLIEVPLSVTTVLGREMPACGGGYLRYFPYRFTRNAFRSIQKNRPVILYLHPYELDIKKYPEYFYRAISSLRWRQRLPLYMYRLNKATVGKKLNRLMNEFDFRTLYGIIRSREKQARIPVRHLPE